MSIKFNNVEEFAVYIQREYVVFYLGENFPYRQYQLGRFKFFIGVFDDKIPKVYITRWIPITSWKQFEEIFEISKSPFYSREIEFTLIGKQKK